MIILTNCLTEKADEGSLKIAVSLVKRIKKRAPGTTVISCGSEPGQADHHWSMNKLFLDRRLMAMCRKKQEPVLYIPFSSNTMASILRTWILTRFAKGRIRVLFVLQYPMSGIGKMLLKSSGAQVLCLSSQAYEGYRRIVGDKAMYLKTGVDTAKFVPVEGNVKAALREKYGIPQKKKVVLHVGHMKAGRNIGRLLSLGEDWHIVLAVSTLTTTERDVQLREAFLAKSNVTLIEDYVPDIQELYQLADVYLFPVLLKDHCIDVPLSALEAAACGIPVVTTAFGELKEVLKKPGFYPVESLEPAALDALLKQAAEEAVSPRESVLEYDWENTVKDLLN